MAKNLFIRGYVAINSMQKNATRMEKELKKKSKEAANEAKINNIKIASVLDTDLLAIGRLKVLRTFLSNFWSRRSFITTPADLVRKHPRQKTMIIRLSGLPKEASHIADREGHSKRYTPIGLSILRRK